MIHVPTAFHVVPGTFNATARLLLISLHFPPGASVGALRWQKLAQLAADRGWSFDVVTLAPDEGSDLSRLAELPPGTRLYGVAATPSKLQKLERWALRLRNTLRSRGRKQTPDTTAAPHESRGNGAHAPSRPHSLPRPLIRWRVRGLRDVLRMYFALREYADQAAWARRARVVAGQLARSQRYAAVISSGPPHMAHDAARRVSEDAALPLIIDFRDPWSLFEQLPEAIASPLWTVTTQSHERRAVARASLVVTNTRVLERGMRAAYPGAADRVITVMNGSDEDVLPPPTRLPRFVIAYAGIFYGYEPVRTLFRGLACAVRDGSLAPEQIGIEIIGHFGDVDRATVLALAEEAGVGTFVAVGPARPRRQALDFLARAALLVTLPGHDRMTCIQSKIFEYVRFDAWILMLAERGSAMDALMQGTGADIASPDDSAEVGRILLAHYREYQRQEYPIALGADGRFSRRGQARILFDAMATTIPGLEPAESAVVSPAVRQGPSRASLIAGAPARTAEV